MAFIIIKKEASPPVLVTDTYGINQLLIKIIIIVKNVYVKEKWTYDT